jgi:hypothetical protein
MILSWSIVVLACAMAAISRTAALAGVGFEVLYSGFVTTVYFVQLTTVLHQSASAETLKLLSYNHLGSLMFNLELLGYGVMAVSTVFIGLSVTVMSKPDWWLKLLLIGHGVFAPFCVMAPILNIFSTMSTRSGDGFAIVALTTWCRYFGPTAVLAFFHFKAYRPVADTLMPSATALQPHL